jgi:hypothetical protein
VGRRARVDGDASAAGWGGVGWVVGVKGGWLTRGGRFGLGTETRPPTRRQPPVASGSGIRSGWGRGGRSAAVARERLTDGSRRMLRWEFFIFYIYDFAK